MGGTNVSSDRGRVDALFGADDFGGGLSGLDPRCQICSRAATVDTNFARHNARCKHAVFLDGIVATAAG